MNILVLGSWHPQKGQEQAKVAEELGRLLAERGHILITSPSSGFQGLTAQSYKKHGGKKFIGFYPNLDLMKTVGEEILVEPDEKIMTEEDYVFRNLLQIRQADGVIAVTGSIGTPVEFIYAAIDLGLPAAYLKDSSNNMDLLLEFEGIKNKANIFIGEQTIDLVNFVEQYKK
ncbi:MAG: hypothetical protein NTV81_02160 [Candidatus Komeilibacteria bacterium]|nr:hypothetical protein [Candidatus Komeilibacteria bacterium]